MRVGIDEIINVIPYDEMWAALFQNEKVNLLTAFGDDVIDIQHFGSTSVHGMFAKPIIDVLIGVKTLELSNSITNKLRQLGYDGFGETGVREDCIFENAKNMPIILL